tara:strand:+ start:3515 stop:4012 length:498 start_codon:yes stop_codon:yes gene_type:complete
VSGGFFAFFPLGTVRPWNFEFDGGERAAPTAPGTPSDGAGRPCSTVHPDRAFVTASPPQTRCPFSFLPDQQHDALITRAELPSSPMTARVSLSALKPALKHAALRLEMANGYLNSRAGLCFVDPAKIDQYEVAVEQRDMIRDEFLHALGQFTGLDPKYLSRLLQS